MKDYLKEHKFLLFLIIALVIGLVLVNVLNNKEDESNKFMLVKYLNGNGFDLISEDTDLYQKKISTMDIDAYSKSTTGECDYLYFKLSDLILRESLLKKEDSVSKSYNGEYNFKSDLLSYSYEVNVDGSYLMISGYYKKDSNKSTCQLVSSEGYSSISTLKDDMCETVKYYNNDLYEMASSLNKDDYLISLIDNS